MNGVERSSGIDPRYKLGVRLETGDRNSKSNEWTMTTLYFIRFHSLSSLAPFVAPKRFQSWSPVCSTKCPNEPNDQKWERAIFCGVRNIENCWQMGHDITVYLTFRSFYGFL